MPSTLYPLASDGDFGLATDLYQLTMAAAYFEDGVGDERASFELFVRALPGQRGYLLVAGLEQALEYLQRLSFGEEAIAYLRGLPTFAAVSDAFFDYLLAFRFRGDVDAMAEGTVAFAHEPLLRVTGRLIEAQLAETFLLATINHQTLVASKAARVVEAARGRAVVDFGARRAHGFHSAVYAARAAYLAGCVGTSNVLAGQRFGVPVYGTAAHSFTMAYAEEVAAFRAFHRAFPETSVMLIDTYDTLEGARRATTLGPSLAGVRLDSGDLLGLSREVRRILDDAGLTATRILASGDLNEAKIDALMRAGAPIDSFGVGTEMITSRDQPALGGVYKLVAIKRGGGEQPTRKLSEGKATYPGCKQVFRRVANGALIEDVLGLADETLPGEPLLAPVLRAGAPVGEAPSLDAIRGRAREQLALLPERARRVADPEPPTVRMSARLLALMEELKVGG